MLTSCTTEAEIQLIQLVQLSLLLINDRLQDIRRGRVHVFYIEDSMPINSTIHKNQKSWVEIFADYYYGTLD